MSLESFAVVVDAKQVDANAKVIEELQNHRIIKSRRGLEII